MRYIPNTPEDMNEMLKVIGVSSLDELFQTIPKKCRLDKPLDLSAPMSEWQLNTHMEHLADRTAAFPEYKVFLGAGRYQHQIPASISYLLGRSEFTTAYTPYQPEMSQGTLQAIYEFQTLCCRLLDMDVATASHYDGATALAEAILVAIKKTKIKKVAISSLVHPLYRQVISTYLKPMGCEITELAFAEDGRTDPARIPESGIAAIVIQSPNFLGSIENLAMFSKLAKNNNCPFIVSFTEPLAYGLLKSPGTQGADLVAGEGQSLGIPVSFGGPGLGIMASSASFMRALPGRLAGQTKDINGERGFVLTLSTREQHIRREKATSNICSNNGLCAVTAAMYISSLGGSGFKKLAQINHNKAQYLKTTLMSKGFRIPFNAASFNEFVVDFGPKFSKTYNRLVRKKIIPGLPLKQYYPALDGHYLLCATEVMSKDDIDLLVEEVSA